jgi:hypothetical protein
MFETKLNRLVKIRIPLTMAAIVLVSTIYHYLTTPILASTPLTAFFTYDILAALLIAPLLYHCLKVMGTTQGLLFFFTVAFFVGGLEGSLTALTMALLVVVPALIAACLVIAVQRATRNKESRKDIWLMLGFVGALGVNLQMTYALQLAFPGASLVYLVAFPTLLPLGMLLVYLTRPVAPDGVSLA